MTTVIRQIALMSIVACSSMIVLLLIGTGLNADLSAVQQQAWPLAVVCAISLGLLLIGATSSDS